MRQRPPDDLKRDNVIMPPFPAKLKKRCNFFFLRHSEPANNVTIIYATCTKWIQSAMFSQYMLNVK